MTNLERFLKRLLVASGWISFSFLGSNGVLSVLHLPPHLHLQFGSLLTKVTLTPCLSWYTVCSTLRSHTGQKMWCLCRLLTWVTLHITWKCIWITSSGKQMHRIWVRVMMSLHVFPTRFINKAYAERKKGCCRPHCSELESYTITYAVLTMQSTGTLKCFGVVCGSKPLSLASATCARKPIKNWM